MLTKNEERQPNERGLQISSSASVYKLLSNSSKSVSSQVEQQKNNRFASQSKFQLAP